MKNTLGILIGTILKLTVNTWDYTP